MPNNLRRKILKMDIFKGIHTLKSKSEVAQSCPTFCNPMDCRLRGSSIHGILQARILEWGVLSFSNIPLKMDVFKGFLGGLDSKESVCNVGDLDLIPRLGGSPGGMHGNPLLAGYSPWGLKSWTKLSNCVQAQARIYIRICMPEQEGR